MLNRLGKHCIFLYHYQQNHNIHFSNYFQCKLLFREQQTFCRLNSQMGKDSIMQYQKQKDTILEHIINKQMQFLLRCILNSQVLLYIQHMLNLCFNNSRPWLFQSCHIRYMCIHRQRIFCNSWIKLMYILYRIQYYQYMIQGLPSNIQECKHRIIHC